LYLRGAWCISPFISSVHPYYLPQVFHPMASRHFSHTAALSFCCSIRPPHPTLLR
ncbi:unnamed protein product, partial [Ectocarpus sp. 8 AP-2014]